MYIIILCVVFLIKELSCIPKEDMVRVVVDLGVSIHTHRHMDKLLLLRYIYYLFLKLIIKFINIFE